MDYKPHWTATAHKGEKCWKALTDRQKAEQV